MLAISIGDVNGIGLEIALKAHKQIARFSKPLYCVHREVLESACALLGYPLTMCEDMECVADFAADTKDLIHPAQICAKSGKYSFDSFMQGVRLCEANVCSALVTLPIHKGAWHKAGIESIGHTHALSSHFGVDSIMMLGCEELFVALFTDHVALKSVSGYVDKARVLGFLLTFARAIKLSEPCCVLGLNPHCGDGGIMGNEDAYIAKAVQAANDTLKYELFFGPYPPDSAFSPLNRKRFRYFVSMYHDVGLAPLKALYFEQSINVSLNLPILRTSVDHGVAFDKAYKAQQDISLTSYINAAKYAAQGGL
ncbi:4-hydroxythreonine-4-phosphate dehydrogenase [Helicobacter jaachi]|uniref:4-hydroxythreonine-4-phosphate dehydrogenase n=1 Tax=Helicobacter jaachi TaxID=1677920 RepID=A0A4U8TCG6_9HELI|nr:4-hydroxythreonine-4-phosphate dehydrogenase [Helicobacter jaachi]TLD97364.1 4-hydroxythreonine-4-phosphate dehydrogenase [Helicobacter jaachi]